MGVYTGKGDHGETDLLGGERVPKDHLRVRTYGTADELSAFIGLAASPKAVKADIRRKLVRIQRELFTLGAELAMPKSISGGGAGARIKLVGQAELVALKMELETFERKVPRLTNFILPGGSPAGAALGVARAVCRRLEREAVKLHRHEPLRPEVLRYLNLLGDWLFVCSRVVNKSDDVTEEAWKG
ncbi:MAG: ATP:cob(I)alamin adenosyltransferase [Bdellovibrionales bacterium RIFOXYD1_FULL_53_11]|nr:MAG: ATP:cob(I)alamin adenosyltransferase [Bdellovibrionales bacterium RIFOXYD1_FULL_53_11]